MKNMTIKFRQVRDKDFEQISVMYAEYIDFKKTIKGYYTMRKIDKKPTGNEFKNRFHGKFYRKENQFVEKVLLKKYGWVAEENNKILVYYQWDEGNEKEVYCDISIWENNVGLEEVADELLAYCFCELKKLGFTKTFGVMSARMRQNPKYEFFKKYADEIIGDENKVLIYKKNL